MLLTLLTRVYPHLLGKKGLAGLKCFLPSHPRSLAACRLLAVSRSLSASRVLAAEDRPVIVTCTEKRLCQWPEIYRSPGEPPSQYELALFDDLSVKVPILGNFQADLRHQFARFQVSPLFLINYRDLQINGYKAHKPHRLLSSLEVTVGSS